jgi:hypothetical protein
MANIPTEDKGLASTSLGSMFWPGEIKRRLGGRRAQGQGLAEDFTRGQGVVGVFHPHSPTVQRRFLAVRRIWMEQELLVLSCLGLVKSIAIPLV